MLCLDLRQGLEGNEGHWGESVTPHIGCDACGQLLVLLGNNQSDHRGRC